MKNLLTGLIKSKHFVNFNSRLALQIMVQSLGLITLPIMSRALGVEKFGELAFASTILGYALLVLEFGFGQNMLLSVAQNTSNRNIISEILSIKIYLSIILFILVFVVAKIFETGYSVQFWLIIILSFSLFPAAIDLGPYYIAKEKILFVSLTEAAGNLLKALLIIIFIRRPEHVVYLACFIIVSEIVNFGLKFIYFKDTHYTIKLLKPRLDFIKNIKYSARFGIADSFSKAAEYLIPLLIGIYLTKTDLGLYNASNRLFQIGMFIFTSLITTFMPMIYRLSKTNSQQETVQKYNILFYTFFFLGLAGSLFTYFCSGIVVRILLGSQFEYSAQILRIWSLMIFTIPILLLIYNIIIGQNRIKVYVLLKIVGNLTAIIISFILIFYYHFSGAITAKLLFFLVHFILAVFFLLYYKLFSNKDLALFLNPFNLFFNVKSLIMK
jgi:O-antigen/teichoic acid export membrane protein